MTLDAFLQYVVSNEFQVQQFFPRLFMHLSFNQGESILRIELTTNRILFKHLHD